jgi:adenylylsulfate kinase-like enzyme
LGNISLRRDPKGFVANHRALNKIIDEMRGISLKLILEAPEAAPVANPEIVPKSP